MIRFSYSNENTKDEEPKRSTVRARNGQTPEWRNDSGQVSEVGFVLAHPQQIQLV
jgi:hypothetical protein